MNRFGIGGGSRDKGRFILPMIRYHRVFVRHRLSTFHYEWDNLYVKTCVKPCL